MRLSHAAALAPRIAALALALGCAPEATLDIDEETDPDAATADRDPLAAAATWTVRDGLHLASWRFGGLDAGARDVWPMWVSGSVQRPVKLRFEAYGEDGAPVRLAVLGPLVNGSRATLASAGYGSPVDEAVVDVAVATTGQLLVVVAAHGTADWTSYHVTGSCQPTASSDACNPWRVDALSRPKVGGLVGEITADGEQLIRGWLNGGLAALDKYEVELWRSPPGFHWLATRIAVSESSGNQVNFIFPAGTIAEGDDLQLVVRPGARLTYADRGVWSRFAPNERIFARLDVIDYTDLGALIIQGVGGFTEGRDGYVLRHADDGEEIDRVTLVASLPGQATNGFASFALPINEPFDDDGEVVANLPHDGDILELGRVDLDEQVHSLGCFEYCNDLAGLGTCTARAVACP